jgi:MFS family permease
MVMAPFAGTLIRRLGERVLIAAGLMVFAGALTWIALIARTGLPYADMVAPLILAGSGVSVAIPPTQSVVMTAVAPADLGKASGTFNMLRQLGGVFGIAICAAVFAAHGSYASPASFSAGFGPAMGACAGLRSWGRSPPGHSEAARGRRPACRRRDPRGGDRTHAISPTITCHAGEPDEP